MSQNSAKPSYRPYRLEMRGKLLPKAAYHVGSGQNFHTTSDSPLLRVGDQPGGDPYIPGSSLRGVLRAHLEREAPLLACGPIEIGTLFGNTASESSSYGRLQVRDAKAVKPVAEIRDHVRIDDQWGAAAPGAKFDVETGYAEAFAFEATYEGEGPGDPELVLLAEALRFLQSGGFSVGAKKAWGLGHMQLSHDLEILEFNRSTDQGLLAYWEWRISNKKPAGIALLSGKPRNSTAGGSSHSVSGSNSDLCPWNTLTFDLDLQFEGPVLIKSAIPTSHEDTTVSPTDPANYWRKAVATADGTFVTTKSVDGNYYLPGSSLRGVLRHEAAWIAGTDANRLQRVDELFGFAKGIASGEAGRLTVGDGVLCHPSSVIPLDHVAVDRIVAAAADGKKFDTAGLESPRFKTRISIQFEKDKTELLKWVRALLRQMELGRLWAGSGGSRGYGLLKTMTISNAVADVTDDLGWTLQAAAKRETRPGRTVFTITNKAGLDDLWGRV